VNAVTAASIDRGETRVFAQQTQEIKMNKTTIVALASAAFLLAGCNQEGTDKPAKEPTIESLNEKVSYMLGYNMASQAKSVEFQINPEIMALAVRDVNSEAEQRFSDDEMRATMMAFQTEQKAKREAKVAELAEKNKQAGQAFLEENAKKEGVVETESGLQYRVLREGEGPKPGADDQVLAHYTGKTLGGNEFDSSYKRGEPAKFPVGSLIPGWVEALQLMPEGSKWELYIPGDLAYGPGGKMNPQTREYDIEPNALLVFELELLKVNPDDEAKKTEEGKAEEK